jgi:hypothetical protein
MAEGTSNLLAAALACVVTLIAVTGSAVLVSVGLVLLAFGPIPAGLICLLTAASLLYLCLTL